MSVLPPHWHSSKQPGESIQLVASPLGNICVEYIPHIPAYLGVARRIGFCLAHLRGNWHILNAWGCWEQKMYLGGFLQPSPDTLIVRARDAKHVGEREKKEKKLLANFSNREVQTSPEKIHLNKMFEKLSESQDEMVGEVLSLYEDSL